MHLEKEVKTVWWRLPDPNLHPGLFTLCAGWVDFMSLSALSPVVCALPVHDFPCTLPFHWVCWERLWYFCET